MQTNRNTKQNKEKIQNDKKMEEIRNTAQKKYKTKRLSTCGWAEG